MYTVRIFMKCIHVCAAQKLICSIKADFPSLADEIAKPHPDMNIKVAAFTVSEKSSNIIYLYFQVQEEQQETPHDLYVTHRVLHLHLYFASLLHRTNHH